MPFNSAIVDYLFITEDEIMLVLSRKVGDRIHIGDDITITLTKISGSRAALGIDAPPSVAVRRTELSDEAASTNRKGGGSAATGGRMAARLGVAASKAP